MNQIAKVILILGIIGIFTLFIFLIKKECKIKDYYDSCEEQYYFSIKKNTNLWDKIDSICSPIDTTNSNLFFGPPTKMIYDDTINIGILIKIISDKNTISFHTLKMAINPFKIEFYNDTIYEENIGAKAKQLNPLNNSSTLPFYFAFISSIDLFTIMIVSDSIAFSRAIIRPEKFHYLTTRFDKTQKFFTFKLEGFSRGNRLLPVDSAVINIAGGLDTNLITTTIDSFYSSRVFFRAPRNVEGQHSTYSNLDECPPGWAPVGVQTSAMMYLAQAEKECISKAMNNNDTTDYTIDINTGIIDYNILDLLPSAYEQWHSVFIKQN